MADATRQDIVKALSLWTVAQQGKTPQEWNGFVAKFGLQDPFDPWPPTKEQIENFLQKFNESTLTNTEAPIDISKNISAQKLDELVAEFDQEYNKVKLGRDDAEKRAKDHIQEIIRHTIEKPDVDPAQKNLLFREATNLSSDNPSMSAREVETKAVSILEKAQPFLNQKSFEGQDPSFSKLAGLSAIQKGIAAPALDALTTVFPGLRQGVLNKNFEEILKKVLNPNDLIDKLGIKAVDSIAFKQMIHAIQTDISRSSSGSGGSFLNGLTSSIFRKSFTASAEQSVATYWEIYRLNLSKGLPPPNANQFMSSSMGLGSQTFHMGADYIFARAKGAALNAGLKKLGLSIPGGLAGGGFNAAAGFLTKAASWASKLKLAAVALSTSEVWIIGGVIALVLFIMIGLPIMTQVHVTNTSLATRLNMGGGEGGGFGPANYTGPPASGPLQCLNYDVSSKQIGDVAAQPFSASQGETVNAAIAAFPQIGLYNCILGCPPNHINMYSGGPNTWWGWAPSSSPGDLVIYDGFFAASGGSHAQARLIAHELAHEWAYSDPTIMSQFANRGYCGGPLCTYPSGTLGTCSNLETVDETFAEAAAMYLIGENLQSLCPQSYAFMQEKFGACATP